MIHSFFSSRRTVERHERLQVAISGESAEKFIEIKKLLNLEDDSDALRWLLDLFD